MAYKSKVLNKSSVEEDWMTTYADAITLLLCFFVLLISVSEPDEGQFKKVRKAFMKAVEVELEEPYVDLADNVSKMISENMHDEVMSVEETEKGLVVEIASSAFYQSGSAEFEPMAIPILLDLVLVLEEFDEEDFVIEVEGHTDDVPMSGKGTYPTNWELSAARATRVVRFFIEESLPGGAMQARAFADTQPKVPNLDEFDNPIEENRELNRRIAIRVERRTD